MDEAEIADAPAEEAEDQQPAAAPPEVQLDAAPPVEEPAPPAEEKSPLDLLFDRYDARLAALEGAAHSGHNLDASAIDQIADLVLERISAGVRKRLLG